VIRWNETASTAAFTRIGEAINAGNIEAQHARDREWTTTFLDDNFGDGFHDENSCDIRKFSSSINCDISNSLHCEFRKNRGVDYRTKFRHWLRDATKPRGMKGKVADALRLHPARITEMIGGKRTIKAEEIPVITSITGMAPPEIPIGPPVRVQNTRVQGRAEMGTWREARHLIEFFDSDSESENDRYAQVPFVPHEQFKNIRQFAVLVSGTSMNKIIPDGFYAVCVPYSEVRTQITDDDIVLVERRRGGQVEGTIKRVRRVGKKWELWPESYDPRWKDPIKLSDDLDHESGAKEETEVEIVGLVIWIGKSI
jgi:hypothetical protein